MSKSGRIVLVVVIVIVVLLGAIGAWYFGVYKPEEEAKEKARLEQLAKAAEEKRRQEAAAQRKARFDQLVSDADNEFNQENWASASSLYTEASSLLPNEQYPKDQLTIVNTKLDEIAALEARKAAGVVETVTESSGRFYVIVSSSIDGDLAMDYASKLAKEGNNVKVITPYPGNEFFHRVSIDDYDSWDQAASAVSSYSFYGEVWVLKY